MVSHCALRKKILKIYISFDICLFYMSTWYKCLHCTHKAFGARGLHDMCFLVVYMFLHVLHDIHVFHRRKEMASCWSL